MPTTELDPARRLRIFRRNNPVRTLTVDGVEWSYRAVGSGAAGLLLLPGSAGGGDAYFRLVERLESSFRCVPIDYPVVDGLGRLLDGLYAILEVEGLDRISAVGGSYGGMVAQALLLHDPSRIDRVVLNSTGSPSPRRARSNKRWQPVIRLIPMSWLRGLLKLIVSKIGKRIEVERDFWVDYYRQAAGALTRQDLESRYRASIDFDRDFGARLGLLEGWTGEILITQGSADSMASAKMRSDLLRSYPRARVKSFEGAGHGVSLERPDEWEEAVVEFLLSDSDSASAP
jgi:pimeloyl-ACP methyl ester carboxylesterase